MVKRPGEWQPRKQESMRSQQVGGVQREQGSKAGGAPLTAPATFKEPQIALIDSRPLVRAAVSYLLQMSRPSGAPSDLIVIPFASPAEFADAASSGVHIDLLLYSFGAASIKDKNVQDDIRRLHASFSQLPLVLLCDHDPRDCIDVARLGIHGYIPTTLSPAVAIQAIHLVHAGGTFVPHQVTANLQQEEQRGSASRLTPLRDAAFERFTLRERDVLTLMWQGKPNKVIAGNLDVSESTVKVYVRQIMKKLGASNRTHAIFLLSQSISAKES
jgi:DNA-binding NarL/FixJ family response regulator